MHGPSLLVIALPLALGCLVALVWLAYRISRSRGRESLLLILGGGLSLLAGAGAVLALWPADKRASVRFESSNGRELELELGGKKLGTTPVLSSFEALFGLTVGPPPPISPAPGAPWREHEAWTQPHGSREGIAAGQNPSEPGPLLLRLFWGRILPGRTHLLELEARVLGSQEPALLEDVRLERSGLLGKGPRTYRVILRAP